MNNNKVLLIVGVIAVLIIGVVLFVQGPAPTSTTDTTGTPSATTGGAKPVVTTTGFASVSSTTAMVVGTVVPRGAQTTYWFEYGPTSSLGFSLNTVPVGTGYQEFGAAAYITGLKSNTQYYFRLAAKNAYGTVYGVPYNFITTAK